MRRVSITKASAGEFRQSRRWFVVIASSVYKLFEAISAVHLRGTSDPSLANHQVAILMMMIYLSGFGTVETGM